MSDSRKWQHNPQWNGSFSLVNTLFLVLTPLLTVALIPLQLSLTGFSWADFALFIGMVYATGMGITAGYHRMLSHLSYESSPIVKFFFLIFGAAALQNSAYKWCSDHRYHHRFVDKDSDPYSISKGFFYAHMGWIFRNDPEERTYDNAKDLAADRLVMWQHKYYLAIAVVVGFGLPALIGALYGRAWEGLLWGGLFRAVFVHHGTFLINSASHTFGTRPYSTKNSARDCWWLAIFTYGEGYHNFHHAFQNDYRNGLRWFHWDPTKWLIWSLTKTGLSKNLVRTPEAHILKARLESSVDHFRRGWKDEMPAQLESMRASLDTKLAEFQLKLREFQAWKESKVAENARWRKMQTRYWKRRLYAERLALESAVEEFKALLAHTERYGAVPCLA
ncbi:MAG: acyl-CoA desaturase [Proteobacteria bacterium]|nr:MAG: acyl-CoA desaturase [Pseudomonadota bacterium]